MKLLSKKASAVTFRATLLALALVGPGAAFAQDPSPFQMTVMADDPRGIEVLNGNYNNAISLTETAVRKRFADLTTLCVAYTMTDNFAKATAACDRAVRVAKRSLRDPAANFSRSELAAALSNRGVLLALKGDDPAAIQDFRKAIRLSSKLSQPKRNLIRAESSETISS